MFLQEARLAGERREEQGLVKLIAERATGELVGGHIVGEEAGSLSTR